MQYEGRCAQCNSNKVNLQSYLIKIQYFLLEDIWKGIFTVCWQLAVWTASAVLLSVYKVVIRCQICNAGCCCCYVVADIFISFCILVLVTLLYKQHQANWLNNCCCGKSEYKSIISNASIKWNIFLIAAGIQDLFGKDCSLQYKCSYYRSWCIHFEDCRTQHLINYYILICQIV